MSTRPGIRPDLATRPLPTGFDAVHGALAHWAAHRPDACALADADSRLSFAELHAQVQARAARWQDAPATVLLETHPGTLERLIDFLAVIATGRCAALADPQWPAAVRKGIARRLAADTPDEVPPVSCRSPFYIGFTSGSTGLPKGFQRHHLSWTESFRVSVADFGPAAAGRVLSPGRLSHSLFLFGALLGLWTGAGSELQENFSAAGALRTLQAGKTPVLVAVPSQLMMLLTWARRRRLPPLDGVELVLISGARWMREHTPALRTLFPRARILEFYGASETSYIAWMDADPAAPPSAVGRPFSNVTLHIGPHPDAPPLPIGTPGLIWIRSPMLFTGYVGPTDATAALRAGPWLSVRDMGSLDTDGRLHLRGRESRMLVTQGRNLFPEEVESRLQAHPGVQQASLHGVPDPLRGLRLHAVLAGEDTVPAPGTQALTQWCQAALEPYKTPRHWWRWRGPWPQTASGKTDHPAIARALAQAVSSTDAAAGAGPARPGLLIPWIDR